VFNITKNKIIVLQVVLLLILSVSLFKSCKRSYTGTPLASVDSSVEKHDVVAQKPIQALNKKKLSKVANIPSAIVKDDKKEILATGNTSNDSGTSTVSAVLDTTTGQSAIIEKRPFSELMNRHELGIEYGMTDAGIGKGAYYNGTLVRIGNFYGGLSANALDLDSSETRWGVMARVGFRWGK